MNPATLISPAMVMQEIVTAIQDVNGNDTDAVFSDDIAAPQQAISGDSPNHPRLTAGRLFAWNRSVLTRSDTMSARFSAQNRPTTPVGLPDVLSFNGTFTVNFRYYANTITDIENFEVLYGVEAGIRNIRAVSLGMGTMGTFDYGLVWDDLTTLGIEASNSSRKYVEGSFDVNGLFLAQEPEIKSEIKGEVHTVNAPPSAVSPADVITEIQFFK